MKTKILKKAFSLLLAAITVLLLAGTVPVGAAPAYTAEASGERQSLYIGGVPFGVRICRDGVAVAGISEDAVHEDETGLMIGDVILEADGRETASVKALTDAVRASGGDGVTLKIRRGDEVMKINVKPYLKNGEYVLGIWTKSGVAGIGTVTYVDPDTREFGGLGHGICDSEGVPLKFRYGDTEKVEITEITKGVPGAPGEIHGILGEKTGRITENTDCGVFGVFAELPANIGKKLYETARPDEVTEGRATLICGLSGGSPDEYEAEIVKITDRRADTKNFIIRVTDERLLNVTGGIVQGMSGSPIIQNGRLVGAVTHVLVADPACGYGIFIDRMTNRQK